jgi:hypothetical protein
MPSSGCIAIDIDLFDAGSFDNCGPIQMSYSSDTTDTVREFCCEDGIGTKQVEFWVTDAVGNQDFVITSIRIQDPNEVCGDPSSPSIAGKISSASHSGEGVEAVEMRLNDMTAPTPYYRTTGENGQFLFNANQGHDYSLSASKNDDPLNGVSTFDILLIQQHILGLNDINDPYTLIAANVNDDNRISGADLIELRKVILGIEPNFPNNESWRFVDADQELTNSVLPRNYKESIDILDVQANVANQDFVGVKIGDVNGSAAPSQLTSQEAEGRTGALVLEAQDASIEAGATVSVPVTSSMFSDVLGYQMTLNLSGLTVESIESGALQISESNYGKFNNGQGTMSWNDVEAQSFGSDEVLFTLQLRADVDARLSSSIEVTSEITTNEAYVGEQVQTVDLRFVDGPAKEFALYQNVPNPVESQTVIGFKLPEAGSASLIFYDAAGKVVHTIEKEYKQGYNEEVVTSRMIHVNGLYYYELRSGEFKATKKMIVSGQ